MMNWPMICRRLAPRARRTPISLVRSSHRGQHDVHDADPADQQTDAGNGGEDDAEDPLGLPGLAQQGEGHGDLVVLPGMEALEAGLDRLGGGNDVVDGRDFGGLAEAGRADLDDDLVQLDLFALETARGTLGHGVADALAHDRQGDVHVGRAVREVDGAATGITADDPHDDIRMAAEGNRLTEGVFPGEEVAGQGLGQHRHRRLALEIMVVQRSARHEVSGTRSNHSAVVPTMRPWADREPRRASSRLILTSARRSTAGYVRIRATSSRRIP